MQEPGSLSQPPRWPRRLWWTLFAVAFGYIEAAVVVYLRRLMGMVPGLDYSHILAARGLTLTSAHVLNVMQQQGVLGLEMTREAATLLVLFGAACGAGRTWRERWGLFGYAFAVWDLAYYLVLAIWIGFPHSLTDVDIYFLIPVAWYGPVWLPVLICMPAVIVLSLRLMDHPQPSAHETVATCPGIVATAESGEGD